MKPLRPLLLTTSIAALIMAAPALAQEAQPQAVPQDAPPVVIAPVEEEPASPVEATQDQPQTDTTEVEGEAEGEDGEPAGTELPPTPIVAIPAEWAPVPTDAEGRSAYGLYLAGRAALAREDTGLGAELLKQANILTPEQPRLREQAFTAAILAGDLAYAATIVPEGETVSPVITEAGKLVNGIETYLEHGARRANQVLAADPVDLPHDRAAVYAQVWIAAEAGDWDRAFAAPPADFDPISAMVARSNRARILEIRRRFDDAEKEWQDLTAHAVAAPLFRLPYGEFLERRGRKEEALALYDASIAANQAEPRIYLARQRVVDGGKPPELSRYREGVAMALRTAADQMIAQDANEFGAVYLRLAQQVLPTPQTQLYIGQSLINANLSYAGRQVLGEIEPSQGRHYANARAQRAVSFEKQGQSEEALADYRRALEAAPDDPAIVYALAGQLVTMKQYDEALELLNGPVLNVGNQGYEVHFLRGAAYEALKRVDEAEAELWAALQLQPDEPEILNYLGYLWVDSGRRVAEGSAMIARAHAANPRDGHIQDSLGWAQFKQGQYAQALENLEQAVAKLPANAELNDHLGDVYWAVGRQREAGFQWQRVLTLDVDAERRAEVEAKLKERLDQAPASEAGISADSTDAAN